MDANIALILIAIINCVTAFITVHKVAKVETATNGLQRTALEQAQKLLEVTAEAQRAQGKIEGREAEKQDRKDKV